MIFTVFSVDLTATAAKDSGSEDNDENAKETVLKPKENSDNPDSDADVTSEKEPVDKDAKPDNNNKLSFEFPFLHSLVKTVEGN